MIRHAQTVESVPEVPAALEPFGVWDQHKLELIDWSLDQQRSKEAAAHVNALMLLYGVACYSVVRAAVRERWGSR